MRTASVCRGDSRREQGMEIKFVSLDVSSLPVHLQLDKPKPKRFADVVADLPVAASYKVTAMSIDAFDHNYRIVHQYYIGVRESDPSNVKKLMKSIGVGEQRTWEDGRQQDGLVGFTFLVPIRELGKFRNALLLALEKTSDSYVVSSYHNLVQYSLISGGYRVFTSLPIDL